MCFQKFPFAKNMEKVMVTPPVKSCKRVIKPRRQLYFPFGQTTQKSIFGSNLVGNLTKIKIRDSAESYTRIARNGEKCNRIFQHLGNRRIHIQLYRGPRSRENSFN